MNQPIKIKRPVKIINNTGQVYLQGKTRARYSIHQVTNPIRTDMQTIRSYTKKSIQGHGNKNNTINISISQNANNQKQITKKSVNMRRQMGRRYEQQDSRLSKSPYLRKEILNSRNSSLNRSNQKIKSTHLVKQTSPQQLYGLKQPHSSLSQHYDPQQALTHKRRTSVVGQDKNYVLEEVKQLFKNNQFTRAIELLKKFLRAKYFLGMSYINNNEFNLGIQELIETINIEPTFKKSLYLVLALAYKKLNKFEEAIEILTKGLLHFPDYYDCYIYRGKLNLKLQRYQTACKDFDNAIQQNPSKGFAYIGKGNALKQMGKIQQALTVYTAGLKSDLKLICYEKRAKCYFDTGKLREALDDYEKCSQIDYNYAPAHFYKGLIFYKVKKNTQAILSLEECLKVDSDRNNLTSAVEILIKIKIEDKDFYQAYHILNRAENIDVYKDIIDQWRLFLQASLFLMKKKCKEAIDAFKSLLTKPIFKTQYSQLNQNDKMRYAFIRPLVHLYKAYGELVEGNKPNAKKQYQNYEDVCKELGININNVSKDYNLLIIEAGQNFPKNSLSYLEKAKQLLPMKPEPYLYLALQKVANIFPSQKYLAPEQIQKIVNNLTEGISHLPQLSNNHISSFYYYRSIIYLYNNQFNKAVPDIDKAIQKSQDNIPRYFYLRGLIFACFGNFSQAVQDFSVSINLDEKYAKPYLQRAKCLQIQGNSNDAFMDLQKYITLAPEDKQIHKYAGFLLFQNCAYEDCLSAFSHGGDASPDLQIIITKAKCNFLLGFFEESIKLLGNYHEIDESKIYDLDLNIIKICMDLGKELKKDQLKGIAQRLKNIFQEQKENTGKIFKVRDIYQLRSSVSLLLQDYDSALMELTQTLDYFKKEKQHEFQKQFVDDLQEFEDEWSEIEIKYNIALCYIGLNMPDRAKQILEQFQKSQEKGKNWEQFIDIIDSLISGTNNFKIDHDLETFQQNHRLSKNWPKITYPNNNLTLSLAFSYPFVEPPELLPEFDNDLFLQFDITKIQNKPEAPWINRNDKGLRFTPNIQVFDQLELSRTTTKQNGLESQKNKPVSNADHSVEISQSDVFLEGEALKKKFKLDSQVQMKLKRLMKK